MEYTQESLRELAERIYDLDAEVYTRLGSSLGRVFNRDRERCVTDLVQLMMQRDSGHQLRSELALSATWPEPFRIRKAAPGLCGSIPAFCMRCWHCPSSFCDGRVAVQKMAS